MLRGRLHPGATECYRGGFPRGTEEPASREVSGFSGYHG